MIKFTFTISLKLNVVVHDFNPRIHEEEAGRLLSLRPASSTGASSKTGPKATEKFCFVQQKQKQKGKKKN